MLINKTIPVLSITFIITFRDTDKKFEIYGSVVKKITNKKFIVDVAKLQDKKLIIDSAKEMYLEEKLWG